ncbi:MAG: endonuclease/exonuclease/phosphatase family protein [Prevotellaceae bacterium]|jgi:endonuclease/exonuclease/phosphatase family metal-dependent hydrolase|nr:endonuclease/exonuclease/phosphatase family protein [Prevotellaceae bacterium]
MKKVKHLVLWPLQLASVVIATGLLCAYMARWISPAATWFFAFFGLFFLPLLVLNIGMTGCWLMAKRKIGWLHLLVVLPALFFLPAYVQLRSVADTVAPLQDGELKILSYNVHLFRLNTKTKTEETLPAVARFVKEEAPAIVCLQEVALYDTNRVKQAFSDYPYVHFQSRKIFGNALFSTVTLSRYPMVYKDAIIFPNSGNVCIFTDIAIGGQTVRVYNNHLESTRLDLALSFARLQQEEKRNEEIKQVSTRLRDAFIKRAEQVDTVAAHIARSPYPALVCGDFNDLPMSYTYRRMKDNRHDTFIDAGSGIPSTFRSGIPAFRIDYIFCDTTFKTIRSYIPKVIYSDHYPVVAVVRRLNIDVKRACGGCCPKDDGCGFYDCPRATKVVLLKK